MTTKAEAKRLEVEANRRAAYDAKVRNLVGYHAARKLRPVEVTAAYEAGKTADAFAAEVAAQEPVGAAIFPLKADAVKAATERAQKIIDRVRGQLEAAGWNLDTVAPHVRGSAWDAGVQAANRKRALFNALTEEDKAFTRAWHDAAPEAEDARRAYFRAGKADIVTMSERGMARMIEMHEAEAAAQYDAFVCKMVAKLGAGATTATLSGSHVWGWSILTVSFDDGRVERWKTQQIWNVSKLGNEFPQWPSRKLK